MAGDDADGGDDGPDRDAILARRRRFIAMALYGVSMTAACDEGEPRVCLRQPAPAEVGEGEGPGATLEPIVEEDPEPPEEEPTPTAMDEGADGEEAGDGAGDVSPTHMRRKPRPRPCLTPRRQPPDMATPRTCLLILIDHDLDDV